MKLKEADKLAEILKDGMDEADAWKFGLVKRAYKSVAEETQEKYSKMLEVLLDKLEELELSYAATIHKSQGSEYPVVILPILDGPRMLFNRNLLYTAVTRAKQCVIIVGSGQKVLEMIDTDSELHRYTSLRQRLIELEEVLG